ncbi:MAG: GMC family oxidoreductase N-terminal domain-containing protein [Elusimicrobiota bacterium]|nr:GMC family oxidoreductase N-terminal domain-containing protein [Elusimicrobiota bacterium]
MALERWDFVVAGSGAGGAAAAARLVAGGARVLLVEEGPPARPAADAFEAVQRYYADGGLRAAFGDGLLPIPTGKTVGGTTTINSGTCLRPPADITAGWERASNGAFSAGGFGRLVEEVWRSLKAKTAPEETMTGASKLFLKGLERLGISGGHNLDRAEDGCEGSGRCCFVCPKDAKMTSYKTYLAGIHGKTGFELRSGTSLVHIDVGTDGVRIGLRLSNGSDFQLQARGLVLACGTMSTPYFVRKFRLGAAWREAGKNLSVHPAAKVMALFDSEVAPWKGVPQGAGVVDPEDPAIRYEGVYVPAEMAAMAVPLEGRGLRRWMDAHPRVATFGFMIRDESRGRVDHPLGAAHPVARYRMGPRDYDRMVRGARFTARAMLAAGARRVLLPFNIEGNEVGDVRALDALDLDRPGPAALQMMAFHPLGTCGTGRVAGWDQSLGPRVFVADGSAVPESLGVNPQVAISALGLRAADALLGARA